MNPNVLIVDDSLSVRMDLHLALSAAGFSVTSCENGATARKALRSSSFALLILDVLLPDANGLEIAQEARAYPPTAKAPIIMLSSEAEVQHRIRGLSCGASEYIGKPYGSQYIVKRARQLTDMRSSAVSQSAASSGPLRILLVDDSPTFLNALADCLRIEGHDVILAKSGSEALSFLTVQPVDGVVLDVFMPGISGIETCRRIKGMTAWGDIPVIMLTGREDSVAKATGLRAGVDDYIVKSPDVTTITMRLSELFRRKRGERSAGRSSSTGLSRGPDSPRVPAAVESKSSPPPRTPESQRDAIRIAGVTADKASVSRGPESTRDLSRLAAAMQQDRPSRIPESARESTKSQPPSQPLPISSRMSDASRDLASRDLSKNQPTPQSTPIISRTPDSSRDSSREPSSPLFEQMLAVSGLPVFIGRGSLKRSLERAGVDLASLTPESLARALPEIKQSLSVFLPAPETEKHIAAIAALTRRS